MKELVTAFGYPFFVRAAVPGIVLLVAIWPIIGPAVQPVLTQPNTSPLEFGTAFVLIAIFVGWLTSLLDYPIYMLYEGRSAWPKWLSDRLRKHLQRHVERLLSVAKEYKTTNPRMYKEIYWRLRAYPGLPEAGFEATAPTLLGNLLESYENYPLTRYGMDSIFYWYRLRGSMGKDQRDDLDTSAAEASALIYVSAVLAFSSMLYLLTSAAQALALLADLPWTNPFGIEFNPWQWLFLGSFLFVLAYGSYRASLFLHRNYGELFKAMFDLGRGDLRKRIIVELAPSEERTFWEALFVRLQYRLGERR